MENVRFNGGGSDAWGLSLTAEELPYQDDLIAYAGLLVMAIHHL